MSRPISALWSSLLLGACSVAGLRSGTEEPQYRTVERAGRVEIREYAPRLAAETVVEGDRKVALREGFDRLAGYIFGKNGTATEISMTAPVAQESLGDTAPVAQSQEGGSWRIRFFMPAKYTGATLPRPADPRIAIVTLPAETVGVWRYSGVPTPHAINRAQRELFADLQGSGWDPRGEPFAWFYDPPWTIPPLRRNEAAVRVVRP